MDDAKVLEEVFFGTEIHCRAVAALASKAITPFSGRAVAIQALVGSPDARMFVKRGVTGIVGALSLREAEGGIQIINLGVVLERRKHGTTMLLDVRQGFPDKRLWLKSRKETVAFYEKCGYENTHVPVGELILMQRQP